MRARPVGEQFEMTKKGITFLMEKTKDGNKTIGRITPYVAQHKANAGKSLPIVAPLKDKPANRISSVKQEKDKRKAAQDGNWAHDILPGSRKIHIAENEREKVSLKIDSKKTIWCYPHEVEAKKKKYGLVG